MDDCLILGGGVIGLSLAYELAGHGLSVRLIDQGEPGRQASWAGAGIIPPGSNAPTATAWERLSALSQKLHPHWAEQLRAETGIDNGYLPCGGLYLADDPAEANLLTAVAARWRAVDIPAEPLDAAALSLLEPALAPMAEIHCLAAWHLPGEAQLRNPRHLRALVSAASARGVQITPRITAHQFCISGRRVTSVATTAGPLQAGVYCLTAGAWTAGLARSLDLDLAIKPIRGQIALLSLPQRMLRRVVNLGLRYLVPRDEGRVLVGSTQEDAGFEPHTTPEAIAALVRMAQNVVPALREARLEQSWAGLRPATRDGLPYIGPVPALDNAFVAAGHFRNGLHLSPATAVVLGQRIRGVCCALDLAAFAVDRSVV